MSATPKIDALLALDDAELLRRKTEEKLTAGIAEDIAGHFCSDDVEPTSDTLDEVSVAVDLAILQGVVAALLTAADPETKKDAQVRMAAHLRMLLRTTRVAIVNFDG